MPKFLSNIINFFKRIFKIKNKKLLPSQDLENNNKSQESSQPLKENIKTSDEYNSEKKITMFLYKQVRLGKLEPQYIPDEYLEKIVQLLKEEKKLKQNEINKMNKEILEKEQIIRQYTKK